MIDLHRDILEEFVERSARDLQPHEMRGFLYSDAAARALDTSRRVEAAVAAGTTCKHCGRAMPATARGAQGGWYAKPRTCDLCRKGASRKRAEATHDKERATAAKLGIGLREFRRRKMSGAVEVACKAE